MIGQRIGPYQVMARLGSGGMGEVYRARDTKLERDVAIKILPSMFTADPERLARFEREARMLAALNHQHIGAIYGLEENGGAPAIVLELVEGPTVADRVADGPLSVTDAIGIATQIAEALEAAHERGIIHRDLKPANIKITPDGIVKVLDFGLAKAAGNAGLPEVSHSPTVTVAQTRDGVILGTPAYMSPEQARGKPVDKRADIWAFGCVLYEMLTGRIPFAGETLSDVMAAILERHPDWDALPESTPSRVRRLLIRCLDKDQTQRLRDIGEARIELNDAFRPSVVTAAAPDKKAWLRFWPAVAVASVGVLVFAAVGVVIFRAERTAPPVSEPPLQLTNFNDSALHPALSPDGRMLTFIRGGPFASSAPRGQIYVKLMPTGEPVQLTRDGLGKEQPVFSPDGSSIIYTAVSQGSKDGFRWDSWQVPVLGGTPQPFLPNASGLVWLDDRQLLYSEVMGGGIHMGIVTSTESRDGSRPVYFPQGDFSMAHRSARSRDGRSVLVVEMDGGDWLPCRLVPFDGSSEGRAVGPLDGQCTTAAWSPDGRWMYFTSNSGGRYHIWRQRYPDGKPAQVTFEPTEQEGTAITPDGKYLITSMGLQQASIALLGPGDERPLTSEGFAMMPVMLPSGDRMFYLMRGGSRGFVSGELWSMNLATGEKTRVLAGRFMANYSISPDGRRVVFASTGNDTADGIWIADLDRRTEPRRLTRGGEFRAFYGAPGEIVYMDGSQRQIYRMKEDGSGVERISRDPVVNLITVAPDGRWAVVLLPDKTGSTRTEFLSLKGEASVPVCCSTGFGPNRFQALVYNWSMDGKSLFVALQFFGLNTAKTVVLPYRSGVPLAVQYPKGFRSEEDVAKNPGARVINEGNVFPASTPSEHLSWRRTTQSNLYRIALPN